MIWILILILNHPVLVKPDLFPLESYSKPFVTREDCVKQLLIEKKKASVLYGYCQETDPNP